MRYYLCVLSILCMSITVYAGEMRSPGKPRSPLLITISPVQTGLLSDNIKPGDAVELKVAASSRIDAERMEIKVELTGGTELISGDTAWSGPIVKGQEKVVTLTVRAPKGQGKVRAAVTVPLSEGIIYSASAMYPLGKEPEMKNKVSPPVRKDKEGRDVIEYRVK